MRDVFGTEIGVGDRIESEAEVKGWRKAALVSWPDSAPHTGELHYYVENGKTTKVHSESGMSRGHRGRPLTLREVVDILDPIAPIKDVPDPAVSVVSGHGGSRSSFPEPAEVGAVTCAEDAEPLTCDDCGAQLVSQRWPYPLESGNVMMSCDPRAHDDDAIRCVYCHHRAHAASLVEFGDGIAIAAPVEDDDGDCWERCNWSEP